MFEAWTAVAAFVAAHALMADFRQTWRLRTLLMFVGVTVLGSVLGVASVLLEIVHVRGGQSVTAGPAFGSLLAAACLAAAVTTSPERALPPHVRWERISLILVAVVVVAVEALGVWLVRAIDPTSSVLRGISASGRPWAVAIFAVTVALFGLSAGCFGGERDNGRERAQVELAAGCLLLAFGPAQRIITPLPSPDVVFMAVVTELAAFCLIAIGARRGLHLRRVRAREAAAAGIARAQLARDLHDGLCQDLAFIVSNVSVFTGEAGEQHPVAIAAERALATARGVLDQFASSQVESDVATALGALATELSARFSISVDTRVQMLELARADTEDVVRIAREAIINAARHGAARHVVVELSGRSGSFVLSVTDDGGGLQSVAGIRQGFGMAAMQERAARLGGRVTTQPARNGGTRLQVVVSR